MGAIFKGGQAPLVREKLAAAATAIIAGFLIEDNGAGAWIEHATAGGNAEPIFADAHDVTEIDTAIAVGETVKGLIRPGLVSAWLADGETVAEGDPLESNGDGTLRQLVAGNSAGLKVTLVAGGSAGNHTVTGIAVGDRLVAVLNAETAAAIATLTDLTSEFSITGANTINNTGGTDTTSDQLWVLWEDVSTAEPPHAVVAYADEAKTASGSNERILVRVA